MRPIDILLIEKRSAGSTTLDTLGRQRLLNSVHTVNGHPEALGYLRQQGKFAHAPRPDLILLDVESCDESEIEALSAFHFDSPTKTVPLVLLTSAECAPPERNACGALHWITKPLDLAKLTQALTGLEKYWFEVLTVPDAPATQQPRHDEAPPSTPTSLETLRLLLIEDSPSDALLFRHAVDNNPFFKVNLTHVARLRDVDPVLKTAPFDLIVTDLCLPDASGLETFRQVQARASGVPVIVLTGTENDVAGLETLRHGAQDYIVKGELSSGAIARAARYAVDKKRYQERLQQSRRLEAVGRLTAGVAHDFNNILAVIRGNAELLADEGGSVAESAADICSAADRGVALARQLLSFSRQRAMSPTVIDLNDLLGKFTKTLLRLLGDKVDVELEFSETLPPVSGDAGMLEQVVSNLALNARDAMPEGGQLKLRTTAVEFDADSIRSHPAGTPGRFVELAVTDTGSGMTPDVLERAFDPFFTTKPFGAGSGLGLATVHGIIQQHRGWLEVESSVGVGTTFRIFLPATEGSVQQSQPPSMRRPGGGETILLVEDESSLRALVAKRLSERGYRVLEAGDSGEALRQWSERGHEIDLVFCDITLPAGANGRELVEGFLVQRPNVPVVLTSGYSPDLTNGAFPLEEGVNFLQKPYELGKLLGTVRRRLDARATRDERGAAAND
ncbi:MAG TPA: response regulator [Polyangiaceae bacterium]|nr:response regulator [Polyangiaceae bacterium]